MLLPLLHTAAAAAAAANAATAAATLSFMTGKDRQVLIEKQLMEKLGNEARD